MKELNEIQVNLKCPKTETNEYSNFKFRNLESILQAVKPYLAATQCTITFNDDVIQVGDRNYIKSTAILRNASGETETATALAWEEDDTRMFRPQVTGTASSYARKYAICSLLAIDDNVDVDCLDNRKDEQHQGKKIETNIDILDNYYNSMRGKVNERELDRFKDFYAKRIDDWNGVFKPEILWGRWMKTAR